MSKWITFHSGCASSLGGLNLHLFCCLIVTLTNRKKMFWEWNLNSIIYMVFSLWTLLLLFFLSYLQLNLSGFTQLLQRLFLLVMIRDTWNNEKVGGKEESKVVQGFVTVEHKGGLCSFVSKVQNVSGISVPCSSQLLSHLGMVKVSLFCDGYWLSGIPERLWPQHCATLHRPWELLKLQKEDLAPFQPYTSTADKSMKHLCLVWNMVVNGKEIPLCSFSPSFPFFLVV